MAPGPHPSLCRYQRVRTRRPRRFRRASIVVHREHVPWWEPSPPVRMLRGLACSSSTYPHRVPSRRQPFRAFRIRLVTSTTSARFPARPTARALSRAPIGSYNRGTLRFAACTSSSGLESGRHPSRRWSLQVSRRQMVPPSTHRSPTFESTRWIVRASGNVSSSVHTRRIAPTPSPRLSACCRAVFGALRPHCRRCSPPRQ